MVIVFCAGLVKLWWTNRATRKLELIDAEKRARRSDMSYCGMDAWKVDDIPFGVRALQRGIEVDGIWISRTNHWDLSEVASSATLIDDRTDYSKTKGKMPERLSEGGTRERSASESATSSTAEAPTHDATIWPQLMPATTRLRCGGQPHFDSSELQETIDMPLNSHLDSYVPSGTRIQLQPERRHRAPTTTTVAEPLPPVPDLPPLPSQAFPFKDSVVYGSARIHANRNTRRPNRGFEILPAGALGPRQELGGTPAEKNQSSPVGSSQRQARLPSARRARLRKNPPTPRLRQEDVT